MEYITQNVARNLKRIRKAREMSLDDYIKNKQLLPAKHGKFYIKNGIDKTSIHGLSYVNIKRQGNPVCSF